jgi:hypothetical protein
VHVLGTWKDLEGVQSVQTVFEKFGVGFFLTMKFGGVGLLGRSNHPEAVRSQRGSVLCLRGRLHMCRGSSLCCSSFGLVVCALCLSMVLSRMCRAVALVYQVTFLFAFPLAFGRLL